MIGVKFSMFLDRPHVMRRLTVYQRKVLTGTGGHGRVVMKRSIRPPKSGKKARTVLVAGEPVIVPVRGRVVSARTGRPVTTQVATLARKALGGRLRSEGEGAPPRRGPSDKLRKFIFFGLDPNSESVVIGPSPFPNQPAMPGRVSVPELLNKGGTEIIFGTPVHYGPRPYIEPSLPATQRQMEKLIERTPLS